MRKKDYIWLTGFILAVVITTFVITINLGLTDWQVITIWVLVCILLQIAIIIIIIVKTKRRLKHQQLKQREE